jgi:tRNA-specific adenosine deaminase 1
MFGSWVSSYFYEIYSLLADIPSTGMKCLPASKISEVNGTVLHDWHAEIVALRSINRFLLEECRTIAQSKTQSSKYVRKRNADEITQRNFQPFIIREDVKLHMYCSEAPCSLFKVYHMSLGHG